MSLMTHTPNRRARLAGEIRAEMRVQGKTPPELATAIGVTPAQARRRLKGKKPFYLEELSNAARFLNLAASELTRRTDVTA